MPNQGEFAKAVDDLLNPPRKKCVVGLAHSELQGNDADSLVALLASPVSSIRISDLLNKNGFKIGETAVWKHRTNNCSCPGAK